ncbi:MAG: lauroyl acyltransferase [Alphaproteobacteria bacterium]|nr:lauroyl acyltransferase [Alphaproteobacteria bacterium]
MTKKKRSLRWHIKRKFYLCTRYPLELIGTIFFCFVFRLLPLDWASAVGGFIGRHIGPRLKVSWVARYNLMKAFPEKTPAEIDQIVVGMWDNLVRTFVEYPHLRYLCAHYDDRIEYVGFEGIEAVRDDGRAGILFSAHIGNWEISSVAGVKAGMPLHRIYRSANNPYVEWLFRYFRQKIAGVLVPKGMSGFRQIVDLMRKNGHFALLIDQKMNEGIEVDFFGYPVMTTPSVASLVLKHDYPAVPVRSQRLKGAHYRLTVEQPLQIEKTGNTEEDTRRFMEKANHVLEKWIRDDPSQWLWVHKRWEDSKTMWKELYRERRLWKKGIKPEAVFNAAIQGRRNYVTKV